MFVEKDVSFKWKKWLGIILFLLVIGASAGHFYAKKVTAPETSVNPVYNALVDKDMAGFYSELGIDKKVIDADNGKAFMEHVQAQDMEQLLKRLNDGARDVYKNGITKIISHEDGTELFKMNQRKKLGFYPVVIVEVSLQKFNLITTHKEVTKTEELSVRESEKESMPIAELKSKSLYSTVVKDAENEAVLYIFPVAGSVEALEEPSFMGEARDKIYSGELELYLANEHGEYGFLQDQSEIDMSGYSINLFLRYSFVSE